MGSDPSKIDLDRMNRIKPDEQDLPDLCSYPVHPAHPVNPVKKGNSYTIKERVYQIGEAMPRPDAMTKVTGSEKFAADRYGPGVLWAGVKWAGVPHARIRAVHTQEAGLVPGVVAVLTAQDVGGTNRQGVIRKDQPVLADDRVRHCGDPLALVVAENKAALEAALDRIALELEPLPAVFDPEPALAEDAPRLHEDHPGGNALFTAEIVTGDGEKALAASDEVVEARFDLPRQAHAFLETENGWAVQDKDGTLTLIVSTQTPFRDRFEVAEALGLEVEQIRIIAPYCGGAFGGKDGITVQSLLALAALRCPGRPVKMWWSREESFLAGAKRHPASSHGKGNSPGPAFPPAEPGRTHRHPPLPGPGLPGSTGR